MASEVQDGKLKEKETEKSKATLFYIKKKPLKAFILARLKGFKKKKWLNLRVSAFCLHQVKSPNGREHILYTHTETSVSNPRSWGTPVPQQ